MNGDFEEDTSEMYQDVMRSLQTHRTRKMPDPTIEMTPTVPMPYPTIETSPTAPMPIVGPGRPGPAEGASPLAVPELIPHGPEQFHDADETMMEQIMGASASEKLAMVIGTVSGAPIVPGAATSDYIAAAQSGQEGAPDDWRWQALANVPNPVLAGYYAVHPEGYEHDPSLFEPTPLGGTPMMQQQQASPFNPQQHAGATILKQWWAGPENGPKIRFVMFMVGTRKYIGCNKIDGSWKQWPVYRPLVIGKTMNDRKARRVARHMDRYMKGVKKVARVLGYKVSR